MMKKLLAIIVLVMVASLSIAGCTSSTNSNQAAGNASQAASSAASTIATIANTTTSASASASATPSASGKIATLIAAVGLNSPPPQLSFTKGESINWAIEVTASTGSPVVCGGSVTVLINGASAGQVTSGGASGCFKTAYFTLNSGLPAGTVAKPITYAVTLRYAGDSTYQPSETTVDITCS